MLFCWFLTKRVVPDWDLYFKFCDDCSNNDEDFRMIRIGYFMESQKLWVLDLCFPELMATLQSAIDLYLDYRDGLITIEIFDYCQPFENIVREYDRLCKKHILGIGYLDWIILYAPYLYASLLSFSYKFHAYEDLCGFETCRADTIGTPIRREKITALNEV